jgi:DNA excision repair protein ERCC-8
MAAAITALFNACPTQIWDTNRLCAVRHITLCPAERDDGSEAFPAMYDHALSPLASAAPLVAVASTDKNVALVDIRTGAATHRLEGHSTGVTTVAWSPDSEWLLASGGKDGCVLFWDIRSASALLTSLDHLSLGGCVGGVTAHTAAVRGLSFTRDGAGLVTLGHDRRIRLWDVHAGGQLLPVTFPRIHLDTDTRVHLGLTPTGRPLMYLPARRDIHLFDLGSGRLLRTLHGHYSAAAMCVPHPLRPGEMYSGSNDTHVLAWTASVTPVDDAELGPGRGDAVLDQDNWN